MALRPRRRAARPQPAEPPADDPVAAPQPPAARPRIAIALGGGVARGWAHIGVLRTLLAAGIEPDIVCGSSIGAVVGGCWVAGKLDTLEDWARALDRLRVLGYLDFRMRQPGLIGGNRLVAAMEENLGGVRIEELPRPFLAVATDLFTGHEVWLREGVLVPALRASISMPGIFSPAKLDGRMLIDGALVNPVPVAPCVALGAHVTIAVNLNGDLLSKTRVPGTDYARVAGFDLLEVAADAESERGLFGRTLGGLAGRAFRRSPGKPSLFGVMSQSLAIILDRMTRSRLAGDPPDVLISPRIGHVGLAEFDRADELIALGAQAAEAALPDIRTAIASITGAMTLARDEPAPAAVGRDRKARRRAGSSG